METLFVEILTFILLPLVLSSNFAMFETRLLGYVDSLQLPVIAIGVRLVGHVITIEPMNLTHYFNNWLHRFTVLYFQWFLHTGMNSIIVYVGSELLKGYFPFSWQGQYDCHLKLLVANIISVSIWLVISLFLLYWLLCEDLAYYSNIADAKRIRSSLVQWSVQTFIIMANRVGKWLIMKELSYLFYYCSKFIDGCIQSHTTK